MNPSPTQALTRAQKAQQDRDHAARVCADLLAGGHLSEARQWATRYRTYAARVWDIANGRVR